MSSSRFPIPQGTLDMLILQILSLEPAHGYGVAQRLQQISNAVVRANQGSLYPALHRLEQKGWVKAEWNQSGVPWSELYYGGNYKKLQEAKGRWDPHQVFNHVLSVEPG